MYEFYLEKNVLCCRVQQQNHVVTFKELHAKRQLQKLDASIIHRVQMQKKDLMVETNCGILYFSDIYSIIHNENRFLLRNILDCMQKEMSGKQKKKHQKKYVRNLKMMGSATIGAFALLALVATTSQESSNPKLVEPVTIEKDTESIMLENQYNKSTWTEKVLQTIENYENSKKLDENVTYLDFENNRYSLTGESAYNSYYSIVETYASKWGIAPKLVMAMLTQESAGKITNLMQIEFDAWSESPLTVYNFKDNCYNHFVLTDCPNDFKNQDIVCITRNDLQNPITNISIGCVLLRISLQYMDYHVGAGIQCYNFGYDNMQNTLALTAASEGIPVEQILCDQENLSFMDYTAQAVEGKKEQGDYMYLNHVMQYVENPEDGISIQKINEFGEVEEICVTILSSGKTM